MVEQPIDCSLTTRQRPAHTFDACVDRLDSAVTETRALDFASSSVVVTTIVSCDAQTSRLTSFVTSRQFLQNAKTENRTSTASWGIRFRPSWTSNLKKSHPLRPLVPPVIEDRWAALGDTVDFWLQTVRSVSCHQRTQLNSIPAVSVRPRCLPPHFLTFATHERVSPLTCLILSSRRRQWHFAPSNRFWGPRPLFEQLKHNWLTCADIGRSPCPGRSHVRCSGRPSVATSTALPSCFDSISLSTRYFLSSDLGVRRLMTAVNCANRDHLSPYHRFHKRHSFLVLQPTIDRVGALVVNARLWGLHQGPREVLDIRSIALFEVC